MRFVALLRGINVGGHSSIKMADLKLTFKKLGFGEVQTYINSGNVIFNSGTSSKAKLGEQIEAAITQDFDIDTKVLLRSADEIYKLVQQLPDSWVNDKTMKCDVLFLDDSINSPEILKQLPSNPAIEDVRFIDGTVVWRIDRQNVTKSKMFKLVGTKLYKNMTARNPNTVRKLNQLLSV